MSDERVRIKGRILYLTEDRELLKRQLDGEDLPYDPGRKLIDNISTDEITPGWVCYYFDETLARYSMVGLRGGVVQKDAIKDGGFSVIVSGRSKGCGSSRETAPYSELKAGVQLVIAESIEKIYGQNSQNIGLLTSTDFSLVERIQRGEPIPINEFTKGLDPISDQIVQCGGLFAYNEKRMAGGITPPTLSTPSRPMTLCEKIIASHAVVDAKSGKLGVPGVKVGDALFVRTDVRFSHEYVTPMADSLFRRGFGEDAEVTEPDSVFAFRDHLTFLDRVMPEQHKQMGLLEQAASLKTVQEDFTRRHGIKLYGEVERGGRTVGSEAICHNKVIEELALPGQVVTGTDSHSCMAGALGCFAFGVGSTDMANAWFTRDVRVKVPETVRFVLHGELRPGVCAKDVMLHILGLEHFRSGRGIGQVLEFAGDGIRTLPLDERATLTNMAVEAGRVTGISEADEVVIDYLVKNRGLDPDEVQKLIVRADEGAGYAATYPVDLSTIPVMVATPGDPRNGIPLAELEQKQGGEVKIDIAYGGSCTGGKKTDMDMYAAVLKRALEKNKRVADGVQLFIQFGSQQIRKYAEERGYIDVFERAGARLVDPSCGACIRAGPGVSFSPDEVTVSAINRNFPGRSGPGEVYLASPLVVAASAIAGHIVGPDTIQELATPDTPFQVGPDTLVSLEYTVFDAEGALVETSSLDIVFGYGALLPAVERALQGLLAGDRRRLELAPEQAYGQRDPRAVVEIDRDDFPSDVAPGDRFEADHEAGGIVVLQVLDVLDDAVVLDGNHPLAGQKVSFELEIKGVRPATPPEIEQAIERLERLQVDDQATSELTLVPPGRLLQGPSRRYESELQGPGRAGSNKIA